jgi:hypothetical protein
MEKVKVRRSRFLLGSMLLVATSLVTLGVADQAAHANGPGCLVSGSSVTVPVGNEWMDGAYTIVVRDGKVYRRHKIYVCGQDLLWQDTGRYVDFEIGGEIGCCPEDPRGKEPILP